MSPTTNPAATSASRSGVGTMVRVWVGSFVAIVAIAVPTEHLGLPDSTHLMLIGSFGAAAVLLFASPAAPFAQPRPLVVGNVMSALVGVTTFQLIGDQQALAAGFAVATAIVVMQLTDTMHPPGGATALIAVVGGPRVTDLGYRYVLSPVLAGVGILLVVALVVHNATPSSRGTYPVRRPNR